MKKIAFVMPFHISEGRGGGAEVQAWLLSRQLAKQGFEVTYICQSIGGNEGKNDLHDSVIIKWLRYAHHFHWKNFLAYYKALVECDPDLVVQRGSSYLTGAAGMYCKRRNKAFAWICTDNASPGKWIFYKGQLINNRRSNPGLFKKSVFIANSIISDLLRQSGMKKVTYAFTQNEEQKYRLYAAYGMDSSLMISGHEPPLSYINPVHRLNNGIILWVANLGPRKRPEIFVSMATMAKGSKLRLVMVGGRPEPAYIKQIFSEAPDNLQWLGKLPFEEALGWFDKAAFLVNTSTEEGEGFPNTFIQSWIRGVPVLSIEVDPDDVVKNNKLGFIKPASELLEVINHLSENPEEYVALSERVRGYAEANHSIEAMTDNFLKAVVTA